ncbi:hypothetical protein AH06_32 [Erwinia phage AH06]|nr:hypothetical protein AH06_32 [Erwinia phage AH06]
MSEITVKVFGSIQAGKTAISSVLDNALRANGIQTRIKSDSALSYVRDAKNHVPNNTTVLIVDGGSSVDREFGNFDTDIQIRGRITQIEVTPVKLNFDEAHAVELSEADAFGVYRREHVSGTDLAVWIGDFRDEQAAIECANLLGTKYGTVVDLTYREGSK